MLQFPIQTSRTMKAMMTIPTTTGMARLELPTSMRAQQRIAEFGIKLNSYTKKLNAYTKELNAYTKELDSYTKELNSYTNAD